MHVVETPIFSRLVREYLDDASYRAFQLALILRPDQGRLIRGSGGLRKIRWAVEGAGKRGGVRIIYYWDPASSTIYCLYLYRKNDQAISPPAQVRTLRRLVEEQFG